MLGEAGRLAGVVVHGDEVKTFHQQVRREADQGATCLVVYSFNAACDQHAEVGEIVCEDGETSSDPYAGVTLTSWYACVGLANVAKL